jgi:MFS family permease
MEKYHDEELNKKKAKVINVISFLTGFSQAMLIYVMAYFYKSFSGTEDVSLFYFVAYMILLVALLNLHKIIRLLGKSAVYFIVMLAAIICMAVLTLVSHSFIGIIFLVIYTASIMISWTVLDIILESFSIDLMSGRIRGLHLTIINAGYLIGPFLSTWILERFDFRGIFFVLLVINSFIFIISLVGLRNVNHKFESKIKIIDLVRKVWRNKDIKKIYYISFCLDFFYALMVIYTSIYLLDRGISWNQIGIIFTIMLIPFVVLQYPVGFLADKKIGEKEMLIFAILLMAISTLSIYFIQSNEIWIWAGVLLATRVGVSIVEVLRDSYFYKKIDGHDVDLNNFFRTSVSVGYIAASAISFILLLFFPVRVVFLLVASVVFSALYPALKLVDNPCEEELKKEL